MKLGGRGVQLYRSRCVILVDFSQGGWMLRVIAIMLFLASWCFVAANPVESHAENLSAKAGYETNDFSETPKKPGEIKDTLNCETDQLGARLESFVNGMEEMALGLGEFGQGMDRFGKAMSGLGTALEGLEKGIKKLEKWFEIIFPFFG